MILVVCFLHTREQMCLHQTPGRRPSRITGRVVNTVTRPWVGAPNERTSCRVHDAVVGFVDRRHRGLGISPLRIINIKSAEFFSGRSWPNICPGTIFFVFFGKLETLFLKKCAHNVRYTYLTAGIFEIQLFMATPSFHLHRSYNKCFMFC